MKSFNVRCELGRTRATFRVHVGRPAPGLHPLKYQAAWLWETRRGTIENSIVETFEMLLAYAREHGLSYEELCAEALGKRKQT